MKILNILLFIFFVFTFDNGKTDSFELNYKITKNLRCLVCQGQSIYDSDSDFAISLKIVVANKIDQGLSEKEIYSFLKEKYGEWILYDPELNKNTYLLWILPVLLFLIGGAIIFKRFKITNK
tara:strand:+ start:81 stop:446 length:366 start_codon:yes stop_codon:yes gene_type:complete